MPEIRGDDELRRLRALQVQEALADPRERDRIVVETLLELRDDQTAAGKFCLTECRPGLHGRLRRLERFKVWLLGVGAALVVGGGLALSLWGLLR